MTGSLVMDRIALGKSEAALRVRIDELEEEIRQLKSAFAPKVGFPKAWRLDPRESTILSALYASRGSYVTLEALLLRIAGFDSDQDDSDVRLWVGRLRKKIEPLGIFIRTRSHEGYVLEPDSRPIVARALGDILPEAAALPRVPAHPRCWIEAENAILRAGYGRGATLAVIRVELMAAGHRARALGSISQQAQKLGLTSARTTSLWSRREDALLRDAYEQGEGIAAIRVILACAGFRRSFGAIQMRAIHLGLSSDRVKRWSKREAAIARAGLAAGNRHRVILDQLRDAGFERGPTALSRFAQTHNLSRGADPWTECEIATLRRLYASRTPVKEIARQVGKTVGAVATTASKLGLKQRIPWSEEERRMLIAGSATGERLVDIAVRIGRPYPNVSQDARRLQLDYRPSRPVAAAAE